MTNSHFAYNDQNRFHRYNIGIGTINTLSESAPSVQYQNRYYRPYKNQYHRSIRTISESVPSVQQQNRYHRYTIRIGTISTISESVPLAQYQNQYHRYNIRTGTIGTVCIALDTMRYWVIIFLISIRKLMLWVIIRSTSARRF